MTLCAVVPCSICQMAVGFEEFLFDFFVASQARVSTNRFIVSVTFLATFFAFFERPVENFSDQ